MKITALTCARGGSKGLPDKNILLLAGRPLIAHAICHARSIAKINRVIVSTDSERIAAAAREAGAEVPFMRPAELAQDDSPEWLVWRHALTYMRQTEGNYPDALVVVPATAPLRAPQDIERCLEEFAKNRADVVITVTDAHRNPYFNMVKVLPDGTARIVMASDQATARRQDAPTVYDVTTVAYVAKPGFVMAHNGIFEGVVRYVHVPPERALDIDTMLDFQIAECLLSRTDAKCGP